MIWKDRTQILWILVLLASRTAASNVTEVTPSRWSCEPTSATDYYGLGVRLGIYFSQVTAWLANNFVVGESGSAQDQAAVFLCANLVSLLQSVMDDKATKLDCLILVHLSAATAFTCLSLWGYRTAYYMKEGPNGICHYGGFGTHFRLILMVSVSVFGIWFWTYGILPTTVLSPEDEGRCGQPTTFMFKDFKAGGDIRYFYIFCSIAGTLYFGIMLLASSLAGYARGAKIFRLVKSRLWRTRTRMSFSTGYNRRQLRYIFQFSRYFNALSIVFQIILVEFTLNHNHVYITVGVSGRLYYPSQLIPAIVGAFGFMRLIYKWIELKRDPEDDRPGIEMEDSVAGQPQAFPRNREVYKLFTRPTQLTEERIIIRPDNDIADEMRDSPMWWRLLVGYLPWLSLLNSIRSSSTSSKTNPLGAAGYAKLKNSPWSTTNEFVDSPTAYKSGFAQVRSPAQPAAAPGPTGRTLPIPSATPEPHLERSRTWATDTSEAMEQVPSPDEEDASLLSDRFRQTGRATGS